jgi:hypothetical protein
VLSKLGEVLAVAGQAMQAQYGLITVPAGSKEQIKPVGRAVVME